MSGRRIGNYQISDYVGSGGFGSVFKAEDVNSPGRIVAIKELHRKHVRNSLIKQRFFQEAVAMARLDHPNLPRLFTFGEDNGSYYLVMEFISGKLLSDELHDKGGMDPEGAVAIVSQVLDALGYAHRNGIIHRDLKPDNIMLVPEPSGIKVKVLDFGIARMIGGESLTLAGEGFGTPAYMSPERIAGTAGDDPRIDIYAAGIILFEMLTGKAPFQSSSSDPAAYWSEMRNLHASEPLPSLTALDVPAELEAAIRKASAKRAEDRYPTADAMLFELKHIEEVRQTAQLAPSGRLFLATAPAAADVYVDDVLQGASDPASGRLLLDRLRPGLRSVRVCKQGYSDYKISVALEAGQQTDLQVALAARATVAMPRAEDTAVGGFGTLKLQGAEESRTALLVIDSLPAGATLQVGAEALARAGEDGRATVRLGPGTHEIQVTAPGGASRKRVITLSDADAGGLKTIAMPMEQPAAMAGVLSEGVPGAGQTLAAASLGPPAPAAAPLPQGAALAGGAARPTAQSSPGATKTYGGQARRAEAMPPTRLPGPADSAGPALTRGPSRAGARAAKAASAILLLALAATSYLVFRGPGRKPPATQESFAPSASPAPAAQVSPVTTAEPTAAKAPGDDAEAKADAKKAAEDRKKAEADAAALAEKKAKEASDKKSADKDAQVPDSNSVAKSPDKTSPPVAPPANPSTTQPDTGRAATSGQEGCIAIAVNLPSGLPAAALRVAVVEQPDSAAPAFYSGFTNQNGRWSRCGLTPGHHVRIAVYGPRGAMLGGSQSVVSTGRNFVEVRLDRDPGPALQIAPKRSPG